MNNFFNLKRFSRLFIKHSSEHYKTYLMGLAVLIGVMVFGGFCLVYIIPEPLNENVQTGMFVSLMLMAGTLFTSTIFSDLANNKKATATLMLPASHFEKYLVGWLFSYLIFQIVFTGIFYLILLFLLHLRDWPNMPVMVFNIFDGRRRTLFVMFAFLQSISLFGAIFFEKLHFIKTAFSFFIGLFLAVLLNTICMKTLVHQEIKPVVPFGFVNFTQNNHFYSLSLIGKNDDWVFYLLMVITVMVWIASYFRLKEKQL